MVTAIFDDARTHFASRIKRVRQQIDRMQDMTRRARSGAQRVVDEVNKEASRLGIDPPEASPVIDIGKQERPLTRVLRGAGVALVVALLASGFFSFMSFFLQFLLAIIIANRFLKIRIDLAVPSQV